MEGAPESFQSSRQDRSTQVSLVVSWMTPKMPGEKGGEVKPHVILKDVLLEGLEMVLLGF